MSTAREEARARGEAFKSQLIEKLDWLSPEDAAAQLDWSAAELQEQIQAGNLIAIEHDQRVLIPAIQISGGQPLPHLSETLNAMALRSPWLRLGWLISANNRLGGKSPLESLDKNPEAVLWVARGVGIQGGA